MKIKQALDFARGDCIAFVGAGGKTSAMIALAREISKPVILSTTTHLGAWQAQDVDRHIIMFSPDEVESLEIEPDQILLITGLQDDNNRLMAPNDQILQNIYARCKQENVTLLIEADGAKQRSLKAPASYEPVIPAWVDIVVAMAGMSGVGKPLDEKWVHRPEIFSELCGLRLGETIEVEDVVKVLGNSVGGLKGVPDNARRVCFLAQADAPLVNARAGWIAKGLLNDYDRILIGNLDQPDDHEPVQASYSHIAGVVLAAGGSKRLGQPKQLLDWQGEAFISKVVKTGLESGLVPLVVVTGADWELVEAPIHGLPITITHNPEWEAGQAGSMQAGLDALPDTCEAVMFLLSDQPQVSPLLIRQLIERFYQHRRPVTAPLIKDQRGNPILFSKEAFDTLRQVRGDQGGRVVIQQFDVDWLPWGDDRALLDVDTEGAYERLKEAYFQDSLHS